MKTCRICRCGPFPVQRTWTSSSSLSYYRFGSENLSFNLIPRPPLHLGFRELGLCPYSARCPLCVVQRTWGLALVPVDLSILVGAENLGFAVVPMAILSARFVERGRFSSTFPSPLSVPYHHVWVVIIGLPITSQHLENQTLV